MSNRIITPNGTTPPQPEPPQTMQELLDQADKEWKLGKKSSAFMKVLNALAMISTGTAQAMKAVDEIKARLEPKKEP